MPSSDERTAQSNPSAAVMYDCECCELPRCKEKSKGIGYYCPECFSLCWCESEDCGRPGARFQTFEEFKEAQNRLHAQLQVKGRGVVDWLYAERPDTYTYDPKELTNRE